MYIEKEKRMKVIFLDLDEVLNGNSNIFLGFILSYLPKLYNWLEAKNIIPNLYGIHENKVKILAEICHKTGAVVVITESWRFKLWKYYWNRTLVDSNPNDNSSVLLNLFRYYNIKIKDITEKDNRYHNKDLEIESWLAKHESKIYSFVVLDSEPSKLFNDRQVCTIDNSDKWYTLKGLRRKHIDQAIKILSTKI